MTKNKPRTQPRSADTSSEKDVTEQKERVIKAALAWAVQRAPVAVDHSGRTLLREVQVLTKMTTGGDARWPQES